MEEWRDFEIAVAQFLKSASPDAQVTHDRKVPDAHTGVPRQRDIWIEGTFGGMFPYKALVSCKYWSAPLDSMDIDHFNGEFISSESNIGIIYSRQGFNDHALAKGKKLGFHCCRLYRNEPPELPSIVSFGEAYHFLPRLRLSEENNLPVNFEYWDDVLDLKLEDKTVRNIVSELFAEYQNQEPYAERWDRAFRGRAWSIDISSCLQSPNNVYVAISDKAHRAKGESTLWNGSYNLTHQLFKGSEYSPCIDTSSSDPGENWEEVASIPEALPTRGISFFRCTANPELTVSEYGKLRINSN